MRSAMALIYLILTFGSLGAQNESNSISYSGVFKGTPLFIQNPYLPAQKTFCIREILINNRPVRMNYNRSAIMLNFDNVQPYSPVAIKILYSDSTCLPVLLNPESIRYHSVFSFQKVMISDSSIHWKAKGEQENANYVIEKFNLGYWEPIESVESKGIYGGAEYAYFPVYEEGPNKFRLKYVNDSEELFSQEVEHVYYPEPITFKKVGNKLILSRSCEYVVTDDQNFDVLRGSGKEVDISGLGNGEFYIIFNEDQAELFRKNENVKVVKKPKSNN